jgi:hypothetical protein
MKELLGGKKKSVESWIHCEFIEHCHLNVTILVEIAFIIAGCPQFLTPSWHYEVLCNTHLVVVLILDLNELLDIEHSICIWL